MEIEYGYKQEERLRNLLNKCGFEPYIKIERNSFTNKTYIVLKMKVSTLSSYYANFEKTFDTQEEIDKFIYNLENALNISLLGINKIKIFPTFSGGIPDFYYYINNKEVNRYDLAYILQTDISAYQNNICNTLEDISKKANHLISTALKYNDLKRNVKLTKENIKRAKDNSKLNPNNNKVKINTDVSLRSYNMYTLDIKMVLELLKNKDYNKIIELLDDLQNKILTGNYSISFSNIYDDFSIEELLMLNEFIKILNKRISNIEETIKHNTEIVKAEFQELKNIIETINSKSIFKAHNLLEKTNIPDEVVLEDIKKEKRENFEPPTEQFLNQDKDEIDANNDLFKHLQEKQAETLNHDEKIALNLYKTQLYRAFNPIISYQRKTNIAYDENIESYIYQAYLEMKKSYEESMDAPFNIFNKSNDKLIANKIFAQFPNSMPSYEQYKNLIVTYLPHLIQALNKVTIDEDIVVYRGTNNPYNEDFSIPLSTTLEKITAREFIDNRAKNEQETGAYYKITIPKGSPLIFYSHELLTGETNEKSPFPDEQQEVLIDGSLYEFEVLDSKLELNNIKPVKYIELIAYPKEIETKKTM